MKSINNAGIKISPEFGIVIRKDALLKKGVTAESLRLAFEHASPLDESKDLISFGPHFGGEAMENLGKKLSQLGLEYIDDFFYFHGDFPEWAKFLVSL